MARLAILLSAALLALAAPHPGHAADPLRVGFASEACLCFAALPIGEAAGIWQRHNLAVQSFSLQGDAQLQQALAAGSIDVGLGSGPGMGFLTKGVAAKAIAVIAGPPADMALITLATSPIKTLDDLKGTRIAVSSPGSLTYWLVRRTAEAQHWPVTAITPVAMGNFTGSLAAMRAGSVNAMMGGLQTGIQLEADHEGHILTTMDKLVPHFLSHVIFARDDIIKNHPDALRAFLAGWFETIGYMDTHRREIAQTLEKAWKVPAAVTEQTAETIMPTLSRDGAFNPADLDLVEQSLVDLKILPTRPDLRPFIDTAFLAKARE